MALASGMAAQLGFAEESTVGAYVPPTFFVPLVSESMSHERERLESDAIIAGRRVLDADMWNGGRHTTSGDVALELYNRGLTTLFGHMFGEVETTGDGPYTHVFTPGDLAGKALTVQVGRPSVKGVVHPFSYSGCKVESWEVACSEGEIATLGLTLVGMSESTTESLATATIPSGLKPLKFNHGSVKIDGAAVKVRSATLSGNNGLATDRRFLGEQGIDEPLEAELRTYEGALEMEFEDLTQYQRFIDGTVVAVELDFTAGTDSVAFAYNARFDGETPVVGGREILTQNLPIKAVGSTDAEAITVTLVNGDTGA